MKKFIGYSLGYSLGLLSCVGLSFELSAKDSHPSDRSDFEAALMVLKETPTGEQLIHRAIDAWRIESLTQMQHFFKWSNVSKTDAVLTRHFQPLTGKETQERELQISIRADQPYDAILLDMAHEMVHATAPPSWDPYDPNLTVGQYIYASIEADGGEVQAVTHECQVGVELFQRFGIRNAFDRCQRYLEKTNALNLRVDGTRVKQDFYRAGEWAKPLEKKLGDELSLFPMLNSETPKLYSSTGHAPYPAALYLEYQELNRMACANMQRRSLASQSNQSLKVFLEHRCK